MSTTATSPVRHLTSIFDLTTDEILRLLALTDRVSSPAEARQPVLAGRCVGLLFHKPSMRTRVSFEAAVSHMHGQAIFMSEDVGAGKRERLDDFARVISTYLDALVVRTFGHEIVEELARHAGCPVINGLSDYSHPCQALADVWTVRKRFGSLEGRTIVFVGDGNNVARSLACACARLGMAFILAAPEPYQFDQGFLDRVAAQHPDHQVRQTADPVEAARHADAVYADVWASMGQEEEAAARRDVFLPYQINASLMAQAPSTAVVMHCLPAHRDEEITSEVLDSDQSIVVEQAANRLPLQKALVRWLIAPETC